MEKQFKDLKGWEEDYIICNDGTLYKDNGEGLVLSKLSVSNYGYNIAQLYDDKTERTYSKHFPRLIMEHFGPPKPSPKHVIKHNDGDKTNDAVWNLSWQTCKEVDHNNRIPVEVFNPKTGETAVYGSVTEAANALRTNNVNIRRMINGERIKGRNKHIKAKEA